jgi:hypothetical protein
MTKWFIIRNLKLLTILIIISFPLISFGQITFEDILGLENKTYKQIQSFMFQNYSIIEDFKEYYYYPAIPCNPPKLADDNCKWVCVQPNYLDVVKSKYPLKKVIFKKSSNRNYEMHLELRSTFAENYNYRTKKAKTFVTVNNKESWDNYNCNKIIMDYGNSISISIQFSSLDDWNDFKSSVIDNSNFQKTWSIDYNSPTRFRYGVRREKFNDAWNGILIDLYESDYTFQAEIKFNSFGIE